jgi:RNA polymerase sigma factor (sigma-70 family)
MNIYKKTEALLYEYKTLVAEVKNLAIEIEELEHDYKGCGAISYEEKTGPTNAFNSSVENEMLERRRRLNLLEDLKFKKDNQVKKIDNALESLDERSKDIVKLKYFEKVSNRNIANRLNVTEIWLCTLIKDAVNQISNLILNIR